MDDLERIGMILQKAGLPLWGVCPFWAVRDHLLPCRGKDRIPSQASSVLCVLFPYLTGQEEGRNVSRYAVGPDYHQIADHFLKQAVKMLSISFKNNKFIHFVDNSPIPEVRAAAWAGLGVVGQNGLLIHKTYGSFVFIGEIVTDLALPVPLREPALCPGCGACIRSCPTGALAAGGLDREKCLSAVSQQKGDLTEFQAAQLLKSGCAWGCDRCQEACPLNRAAAPTPYPAFLQGAVPHVTPQVVEERTDRAYLWRGKWVILRNLKLLGEKKEEP